MVQVHVLKKGWEFYELKVWYTKKAGKFLYSSRLSSAFYTKILRKDAPYGFISLFIKH